MSGSLGPNRASATLPRGRPERPTGGGRGRERRLPAEPALIGRAARDVSACAPPTPGAPARLDAGPFPPLGALPGPLPPLPNAPAFRHRRRGDRCVRRLPSAGDNGWRPGEVGLTWPGAAVRYSAPIPRVGRGSYRIPLWRPPSIPQCVAASLAGQRRREPERRRLGH
ncbi:uncharacterized protein LOC110336163 [Mus pahari]|uniref:uncharacterized protein LOC110336163 n=1 Tax=Mus pahari TaxID=10093 RepID=UPI000A30A03F|nr:uncharacterized protein LOC110336163 [Mus pahari]